MNRSLLIGVAFALVVGGVVTAVALRKPPQPPPASSFNPVSVPPPPPDAAPPAIASASPLAAAAQDAGVTPNELRNWRTRIDPELCSKGAEQLNKLDGRAPTDPKAINTLSLCLQYGNVAWYRCLLEAKDIEVAKTCNTRFLQPSP